VVATTHQAPPHFKSNAPAVEKLTVRLPGAAAPAQSTQADAGYLRPSVNLVTSQPSRRPQDDQNQNTRQSLQRYVVQPEDVLSAIAAKFSVTTMTLVWANNVANPNSLQPGAELVIPPTSGVLHKVTDGDTVLGIAQKYNVGKQDITGYSFNKLADPDALVLDQLIMIPGALKPADPPPTRLAVQNPTPVAAPAQEFTPGPELIADGSFAWPAYGQLSQGFTYGHRGLDIAKSYGYPVIASDSGIVAWVQYLNSGYGYHLLIDHGNGYQTLYSHFSEIFVVHGQRVSKGEQIGRMGTTGWATGPHVHFEVHQNGIPINPLLVLPR